MNRRELQELVSSTFDGVLAKKHVEEITKFYRTAGSSGYHQALEYAKNQLDKFGVAPRIESYPLDGETELIDHKMPLAWEPTDASLEITSPVREKITSFSTAPTCMMWWSAPTPPDGVEADVIDVGAGVGEEDYAGLDAAGKIVLAAGDGEQHSAARIYSLAVEKRGAVGILTDCLLYQQPRFRTREGKPDLVQLFRLEPKKNRSWGLALSLNQANRIRELCRNGRLTARVAVNAKLFSGTGENMVWELGAPDAEQQIFMVAHISATKPAANCASGPAALLEITRALHELQQDGKLEPFLRRVRFLIGAEGHGVSAYFGRHTGEISGTVAAYCLDSVGHDQAKCNSSIVFYRTPDSTASFINELTSDIFEGAQLDGQPPYKSSNEIALFRFSELAYAPWSDNSTLTALGIPCPLIMSWPDTYFHTQALDFTKTDPDVFHFTGSALATAVAFLASATQDGLLSLAETIISRARLHLAECLSDMDIYKDEFDYITQRDIRSLKSVLCLIGKSSRLRLTNDIKRLERSLIAEAKLAKKTAMQTRRLKTHREKQGRPDSRVPVRTKLSTFPRFAGLGYDDLRPLFAAMARYDPVLKFYALVPLSSEIGNLVDGKRSVAEIAKAVSFQYHLNLKQEHVFRFLESLEKLGYISFAPKRKSEGQQIRRKR